jgi:hypothetical protein
VSELGKLTDWIENYGKLAKNMYPVADNSQSIIIYNWGHVIYSAVNSVVHLDPVRSETFADSTDPGNSGFVINLK